MPDYLPLALAELFTPRPPMEFWKPIGVLKEKKRIRFGGVSDFMDSLNKSGDDGTGEQAKVPTAAELRKIRKAEFAEQKALDLEIEIARWDPEKDQNIKGNPFKTLFVSRISYLTDEATLKKKLKEFGDITRINLVRETTTNKSRGYAFVVFKHESDMLRAYKEADGMKIDDRRIVVDFQRSLTVKNWKPRKLGGGLGATRKGPPEVNSKMSKKQEDGMKKLEDDKTTQRGQGHNDRRSRDQVQDHMSRERPRRSRSRGRGIKREHDDDMERSNKRRRSRSRDYHNRRKSRSRDRTRVKRENIEGESSNVCDFKPFISVKQEPMNY